MHKYIYDRSQKNHCRFVPSGSAEPCGQAFWIAEHHILNTHPTFQRSCGGCDHDHATHMRNLWWAPLNSLAGITATVTDPHGQAGPDTPVWRGETGIPPSGPIRELNEAGVPTDYQLAHASIKRHVCEQCGMGFKGSPHLCVEWNYRLMTEAAKADLTAVVTKHAEAALANREPIVTVRMNEATIAFLRERVGIANSHIVRISDEAVELLNKNGMHDDEGRRLTMSLSGQTDLLGEDLVIRHTDDPEWVKEFVHKHEEKKTAMPICCATPDPRISKSGRPYCHSCKKYLDRVPPPQLPTNPKPTEAPAQ